MALASSGNKSRMEAAQSQVSMDAQTRRGGDMKGGVCPCCLLSFAATVQSDLNFLFNEARRRWIESSRRAIIRDRF